MMVYLNMNARDVVQDGTGLAVYWFTKAINMKLDYRIMDKTKRKRLGMFAGKCLDIIHYGEKELSCVKYLFSIFGYMVLRHDYFILILPKKHYKYFVSKYN